MRLLIVEDHPDTAKTLAALLGMGGHTVSIAHNGTDALKLVTEQIFDIMISDLGLPDMTGYHLLRQIKQQRSIKAIAMSGYGMEEDINKSKQAGFVDHIVKPATIDQLEQVLYRVALQ
jgi:CheY-like chemotaxis protein